VQRAREGAESRDVETASRRVQKIRGRAAVVGLGCLGCCGCWAAGAAARNAALATANSIHQCRRPSPLGAVRTHARTRRRAARGTPSRASEVSGEDYVSQAVGAIYPASQRSSPPVPAPRWLPAQLTTRCSTTRRAENSSSHPSALRVLVHPPSKSPAHPKQDAQGARLPVPVFRYTRRAMQVRRRHAAQSGGQQPKTSRPYLAESDWAFGRACLRRVQKHLPTLPTLPTPAATPGYRPRS
jgi:hypothetical protein